MKRSCEESPEYSSTPRKRGWSLHHKSKSDLHFPALPGRRRPGSQSFTPSRPHSNSRSSTTSRSRCRDSTLHTSRKRPVNKPLRLTEVTLTQSPAQKTLKLKSIVQRVPATKNYQDPPYRSLETDPREFIRYLMGNLDQKAYDVEIRSLAAFYSQATVIARCVIASTITTLVVANRGIHFLVPFIPRELMNLLANPRTRNYQDLLPTARITRQMSESIASENGRMWCASCNTGMTPALYTPMGVQSGKRANLCSMSSTRSMQC